MKIKAIVTGHSRGLGTGIAQALLARGVKVLGLSRKGSAQLAQDHPDHLEEQAIDLSDLAALSAWLAGPALERFLADADQALLVNNAGIVAPIGPLTTQLPATVAQAITVNVSAPLMMAAAFAQVPTPAQQRRILHVSSGAGRSPYPGWSVYCATKAALDQHARCVVLDSDEGLRISSLAPGVIDTGMQHEIRATDPQRFPMHDRFVRMAREGALADAHATGASIASYLLSTDFGEHPVADLRDLSTD